MKHSPALHVDSSLSCQIPCVSGILPSLLHRGMTARQAGLTMKSPLLKNTKEDTQQHSPLDDSKGVLDFAWSCVTRLGHQRRMACAAEDRVDKDDWREEEVSMDPGG